MSSRGCPCSSLTTYSVSFTVSESPPRMAAWILAGPRSGPPAARTPHRFASILFGSADRSLRMNFFLPLKRTTISQRSSTSTFPTSSVCACSTVDVKKSFLHELSLIWPGFDASAVCAHAQQHAEAGDVSCPVRQPPQSASAPTSSPLGLPPPSCSMALSGQVSQIDSDGSMRV
ncbi:uncharacterized protein LOC119276689 isoform X1 [Triticum dicoccoides]|uniref:uncharacterized protein LOC119276689 isoform X1 n=1 Tax=Triticum dicoccoides TaxID=85692 RepID=UPI00188E2EAE|nr:uncharacterized protein LOC119276689 isoform X1 [Triticum dicoccoides]